MCFLRDVANDTGGRRGAKKTPNRALFRKADTRR